MPKSSTVFAKMPMVYAGLILEKYMTKGMAPFDSRGYNGCNYLFLIIVDYYFSRMNVMRSVLNYKVIGLFFLLIPLMAYGKRFTNEYTEFELPPGWECVLEGSEWVCQSTNEARKKEAIIILVAKIRGPQDTIEEYSSYLQKTKTYKLPGGKSQVSEPKYTKFIDIAEQRWVDSLHLASEVPGFYTRYVASTKEDLGMAITFSVSKEHYDAYRPVFDRIVETLRMFRQKKVALQDHVRSKEDSLFDTTNLQEGNVDGGPIVQDGGGQKPASGGDEWMLILLLLALAGGGFVIMKKRKKK